MSQENLIIRLKRVYEEPAESDGTRVLVERLWPRGLSRERAHIDLWLKDVAPSDALRRWFAHDPQKFAEFRRRYEQELRGQAAARAALTRLRELAQQGPLTLVYSARDSEHNNAVVLRDILERDASAEG
uniref:DUF488 domain-containing protein n=1 Tax=Thermogemmatispora argillosa TaxID=2045280 RepID=A0A455T6U7_9CHLR|nr:hypothetical protein KTA_18830 [Thermogemmatispora argillosa]